MIPVDFYVVEGDRERLLGVTELPSVPQPDSQAHFADGARYRVVAVEVHLSRPVITTELDSLPDRSKAVRMHRSNTGAAARCRCELI